MTLDVSCSVDGPPQRDPNGPDSHGGHRANISATVTAIDHATRGVTLRTEDGDEFSLVADDAVKNLDQVSEGDVVVATCTEALAYEVIKGGEEANLETTAAAAAAELGQMPGAVAGRSTTLTVTVTAIDTEAPSITFMGPGGNTRTIEVLYPEKLEGVSVGDSVEITYAEALALSVEKVTVPAAPQNVSVVMVTLPTERPTDPSSCPETR